MATSQPSRLDVGSLLGPYRLEAAIGAGGMGQVFRATDTRLHRTVAIKILTGSGSDAEQRGRFLQEARAASALNHPNIVIVHDISSDRGIDFLVMEHISGKTLKDLIGPRGLPLETLTHTGTQIASALAAAHAAGIIHRDIKPANVMVTATEQVKVLDFGLAKHTAPEGSIGSDSMVPEETLTIVQTTPGMVMGTFAYMSPEQVRGEVLDARSDIFSLGCVLYEAATGQRAFRGENIPAVILAIATQTPDAPSTLRPDLPAAFDQLIARCLAKEKARRPSSAADVAEGLAALTATPVAPPSPGTVEPRRDTRSSIAVLPFQFRTAAPDDQFLSVALVDALINRLSSSGKVLVRPMASVMKYAGKEVEWLQAARDLNADAVVQGTIQKSGPRVRVMVQAYRAADSESLHSAKFDGSMDDLFALQDQMADSVFTALALHANPAEPAGAPPTKSPVAYEMYLRAVDRIVQVDKFDTQVAIDILGRVLELDPMFTDAWGQLAQAYTQMGMHLDPDPKWLDQAERAIAKTLELDPLHCDALCARGQVVWTPSRGFQNRAGLRALNAALKINPSREQARMCRAVVYFHLGFFDEARRDTDEALLINPGHVMSVVGMGTNELCRGNFESAEHFIGRALSLNPANVHANLFYSLPAIILGRLGEARERLRAARQRFPEEPQLIAQEGLILACEGSFTEAEQRADQAVASERSLTHSHHSWHDAAKVYTLCGRPEKAIHQLRRCAEMGLPNYPLFRIDPHLRGLHENPDFQSFLSDLRRQHESYRQEFGLGG